MSKEFVRSVAAAAALAVALSLAASVASAHGGNASATRPRAVVVPDTTATPVRIAGLPPVVDLIDLGLAYCARAADGVLWCWGAKRTETQHLFGPHPAPLRGLSKVVQADQGGSAGCGVTQASGAVFCWGTNVFGQLGNGHHTDNRLPSEVYASPAAVPGLSRVTGVSVGGQHACAWLADGTAWCWGTNRAGQLGDGTTDPHDAPVQVAGIANARQLALGQARTCGLFADRTVHCWGNSTWVGVAGGDAVQPVATPLAGATEVAQIALGDTSGCFTRLDGTVWCWGANHFGQLGDGTFTGSAVPRWVAGVANATQVASGLSHACACTSQGTVYCWGSNNQKQLGRSELDRSSIPLQVPGLSGVAQVALGGFESCARKSDGSVWCWGESRVRTRRIVTPAVLPLPPT